MTLDLSNLGGEPSSTPSLAPIQPIQPIQPPQPVGPQQQPNAEPDVNTPQWLKGLGILSTALFAGSKEGGIPIISDFTHAVVHDLGGGLVQAAADFIGSNPTNIGDPKYANLIDLSKYGPQPGDAVRLLQQSRDTFRVGQSGENLSAQFMLLGQWQQQHDPEAFALWQAAQQETQKGDINDGKRGEIISSYINEFGSYYADQTSTGLEGWYEVAPELAFAPGGSTGQSLMDALRQLVVPQRFAERGAAALSGHQSGLNLDARLTAGVAGAGSRLNELLALSPNQLSEPEAAAVKGLREQGWTFKHALNYLVDHGEGYSHNPLTQIGLSIGLDPLTVAQIGGSSFAKIAGAAAVEGMPLGTSVLNNKITRFIGTTVKQVNENPLLGPSFRAARTIIDPFSALGKSKEGIAAKDTLAALAVDGMQRAYNPSAFRSIGRLFSKYGKQAEYQSDFGVSAANGARRWTISSYVDNAYRQGTLESIAKIDPNDIVEQLSKNPVKDAATRIATYFSRIKQYDLAVNKVERDALINRFAKTLDTSPENAAAELAKMSDDEMALVHQITYSRAQTEWQHVISATTPEEWGGLADRVNRLVLGNPTHLTHEEAVTLYDAIAATKGLKNRIGAWNDAAEKFTNIDDLGKVKPGAKAVLDRKLKDLNHLIESGRLHAELPIADWKSLPQKAREFLDRWSAGGRPLWKVAFRPADEQAFGLARNSAEELYPEFSPNVGNVTTAAPVSMPGRGPVTDFLGRVTKGKSDVFQDSFVSAYQIARDAITGERMLTGMEQKFLRGAKSQFGLSPKVGKQVFRAARDKAAAQHVTLGGLTPDQFWEANATILKDTIDVAVAKREMFSLLVDSAGGDLRLIGLSAGTAQRLRAALFRSGNDPNNLVGQISIGFYNTVRYVLNPTFFIQAPIDGPWFNIFRGIMPVGGGVLKEGTPLYQVARVMKAMASTGMVRNLQLDFTERSVILGFTDSIRNAMVKLPGMKEGFGERLKNWSGRLVLNNELAYAYSQMGEVVFDGLRSVEKTLAENAKNATNSAEKAAWESELEIARSGQSSVDKMLQSMREEMSLRTGAVADDNAVGLQYLSEIIDDSRLEVRDANGLLNYRNVNSAGAYRAPADIGELKSLDLDYAVAELQYPNIHTVADLRVALAKAATGEPGGKTVGEMTHDLLSLGYHRDHVARVKNSLTYNGTTFWQKTGAKLGMSKTETGIVRDVVARTAKLHGMNPVDYITQVLPMTARGDVEGEIGAILNLVRLVNKPGEKALDELTRVVSGSLHPSAQRHLLDSFEQSLPYRIQAATDAGDKVEMVQLQARLEALRGGDPLTGMKRAGWNKAADEEFRDLVLRRAGGEAIGNSDVEAVAEYFSKFVQDVGPGFKAGEVVRDLVKSIPTANAAPYHVSQAMIVNALGEGIRLAEKDAIRLAAINPERSMLERSLNHPVFGLYPTSYMWGKVLPETVRFLATNPFGLRTGAGLSVWHQVAESVGAQREYDDRFEALYQKLGKSAVISFLSYLTPGMSWEDMKGRAPAWVRELVKSGDFGQAGMAQLQSISALRWVQSFQRATSKLPEELGTIGQFVGGPELQQAISGPAPTPASGPADTSSPIPGASLAPVLEDDISVLRRILSQ